MSRVARRPPAFYLLLAIALTGCTHDVSPSAIAPASVSTSRSTGSERVSLLFAPARDSVRLEDSAIALAASYLQTLPLGHENDAVLADAAQHLTGAELAIAPSLDLDRAKMSADVVAPTPISLADAATFVSALALASPTAEQLARRSSRLLGSEVLAEAIAMPVLPLEATGAIAGTAWQDTNANTEIDSGELLLSERIVFLDRNLDGTLDPDEASTITNADGRYQFDRLFPGTYAVSLQADSRMFPAIVGGTPSNPSDWPWMVAIVRADEPAFPGHICGATVVHSHWVLTAAHCLHRNITKLRQPEEIEVLVGRSRLSGTGGERIAVKDIVVFPHYTISGRSLANDIGLIKLDQPIPASIPTIDIARPRDNRLTVAPNVSATVLGWGRTDFDDEFSKSDELRQVSVPIASDRLCREVYAGRLDIPEASICAGFAEGGSDSCVGDSGGPLLVRESDRWLQVGLVSFGDDCAKPNSFGVYTRIADFESWIVETINGSESNAQIVDLSFGESVAGINISE